MSEQYFVCERCGNIITKIEDKGYSIMCCGEKIKELTPGAIDATIEKHILIVETEGNEIRVKVGAVKHPMINEHYIKWISLYTDKGYYLRKLNPEDKPETTFYMMEDEKPKEVYEYCNIHGLRKKEL